MSKDKGQANRQTADSGFSGKNDTNVVDSGGENAGQANRKDGSGYSGTNDSNVTKDNVKGDERSQRDTQDAGSARRKDSKDSRGSIGFDGAEPDLGEGGGQRKDRLTAQERSERFPSS